MIPVLRVNMQEGLLIKRSGMKKTLQFIALVVLGGLLACQPTKVENQEAPASKVIGKQTVKLNSDVMYPEVLWYFGRVGAVAVSPDNQQMVYGITWYDIAENKGNTDLYLADIDGKNEKQLTKTPFGEYEVAWYDANHLVYMSSESGSMQIWMHNVVTGEKTQLSQIEEGIGTFRFSADRKKLLYTRNIKIDKMVKDLHPDLPKANAYVETNLMYRHWDVWHDGTYSHIFVADFEGNKLMNDKDIMAGQPYDSPLKPHGGLEQIQFSPDGQFILYSVKQSIGKEYAKSTNSDIFQYNLTTGEIYNLSDGMLGYDLAAVYSPDGTKIAWQSMARDGYEADKNRLILYDVNTKERTDVSAGFDRNAGDLSWSADGSRIYFVTDNLARYQIYYYDLLQKSFVELTKGDHNYVSVTEAGDHLIGTKQSMAMPTEIFAIHKTTGEETQLSFVNKDVLDQLTLAKSEERWIKTTDGKDMLVWVIYPPHFDATKKYPALLYCQGGPQSSVSQFFSYRWNFQMMAANGYVVVAPNRRGLPSFGQAWNEQISGDYGGQNMKDYLSAIDAVSQEPFIDKNRLGAVGASYGGFSVYWLAGHHEGRFKAFIAHDGMFNLESQYLETEEMFFVNWDLGGPFWDKTNKIAQNSYANSPHRFVQNWDTPILVIHGEQDFRIAYTQGMSAYNAAVLRGIPAKYLHFPTENHWVLAPQNSILWQREFKSWLDTYLK